MRPVIDREVKKAGIALAVFASLLFFCGAPGANADTANVTKICGYLNIGTGDDTTCSYGYLVAAWYAEEHIGTFSVTLPAGSGSITSTSLTPGSVNLFCASGVCAPVDLLLFFSAPAGSGNLWSDYGAYTVLDTETPSNTNTMPDFTFTHTFNFGTTYYFAIRQHTTSGQFYMSATGSTVFNYTVVSGSTGTTTPGIGSFTTPGTPEILTGIATFAYPVTSNFVPILNFLFVNIWELIIIIGILVLVVSGVYFIAN